MEPFRAFVGDNLPDRQRTAVGDDQLARPQQCRPAERDPRDGALVLLDRRRGAAGGGARRRSRAGRARLHPAR
jgi:hypothetical protein